MKQFSLSHRIYAICFAVGFSLLAMPAWAKSEHDMVREAVMTDEIMPLELILQRAQKVAPGRVLKVELEQKRGMWIYEIKLLHEDGALSKLYFDARDGTLLQEKQKSYKRR